MANAASPAASHEAAGERGGRGLLQGLRITADFDPTRVEFGNVVLGDRERRGLQTRLSTMQTTPIEVVGAETFPPVGAPLSAFAIAPAFVRTNITTSSPASFITTFTPLDTVLHQGVVRFRTALGDTLYGLLSGRLRTRS